MDTAITLVVLLFVDADHEEAFERYRSDPGLAVLAGKRARAFRRTVVCEGVEVETEAPWPGS